MSSHGLMLNDTIPAVGWVAQRRHPGRSVLRRVWSIPRGWNGVGP